MIYYLGLRDQCPSRLRHSMRLKKTLIFLSVHNNSKCMTLLIKHPKKQERTFARYAPLGLHPGYTQNAVVISHDRWNDTKTRLICAGLELRPSSWDPVKIDPL
jgi:hypothetical protein